MNAPESIEKHGETTEIPVFVEDRDILNAYLLDAHFRAVGLIGPAKLEIVPCSPTVH